MSPISTFSVAIDIQAGRIPVQWTVRDHELHEVGEVRADGVQVLTKATERVFWPQVRSDPAVPLSDIDNPPALIAYLFRSLNTNWTEAAALAFLDAVGAWQITPAGTQESWAKGTYANVTYRHRHEHVRVVPITMDHFESVVSYWYRLAGLLGNPAKLKREFKLPGADAKPGDDWLFAMKAKFSNTLPVSLEWSGKDPRGVIEPITGAEILAAYMWSNVAVGAGQQTCAYCHTRFLDSRKRKSCPDGKCARRAAQRNQKGRYAEARKLLKADPTQSPRNAARMLRSHGIKVTPTWIENELEKWF